MGGFRQRYNVPRRPAAGGWGRLLNIVSKKQPKKSIQGHMATGFAMVAPDQPWLDGFVVDKGCVRQFFAMPQGAGYSAEEQLTGEAVHGGLQLAV